jgi:hypothetical protein
MLRVLALLLLLANVLFFAWTQGALDPVVGVRSLGDREPEREALQVRPGDLLVVSAASAAAQQAPVQCLEAGPFSAAQVAAVEQAAVTAQASLTWSRRNVEQPAVWALVMGPYPNRETIDKKIEELKRTRVTFEELTALPNFKLALSVGQYESQRAANTALAALSTRGIKTARVAQLSAATSQIYLRTETNDSAALSNLRNLSGEQWGTGWGNCRL